MRVLAVASELYPLIKTGGLADVTGALPRALAAEGIAVTTLLPGYPAVMEGLEDRQAMRDMPDWLGGPARLLRGKCGDHELFVLDSPRLYARGGNPYVGPDGRDWPDNGVRFAALGRAAADLAAAGHADALHLHDWQAGLAAAYVHQDGQAVPIVATIHNLAFQGIFAANLLSALRLSPALFTMEGIEFHGAISTLKASIFYASAITTVSPGYAQEITSPDGGMGLDGLLRARGSRLQGILNGIDTSHWNPMQDPMIAHPFGPSRLADRRFNKSVVQKFFGLAPDPDSPLCVVVSRLTWQKGVDVLLEAVPDLLRHGMQLAVLGSGEPAIQAGFAAAAGAHPGRISCQFGYDEALAHQMQAGADLILVPSRFEPCGLTQLCALRYGTVPLVARTGGLADTVIDANAAALAAGVATGFQFAPVSRGALDLALARAATLWRDQPAWQRVQLNGMGTDVSWAGPARAYAALFRRLAAR